jgi:thiol-disulfide isomerase/thioredoxin
MLLLAICLLVADQPLSTQIARMESDFAALEKSFDKELHEAKQNQEKLVKANDDYDAKWRKSVEELTALIKRRPDDAASLDGILLLTGPMRWTLDDELIELALRKRDDARMGRLCFQLMFRGEEPWAQGLVKAVAESNPSRDVRGQAVFCRGVLNYTAAFPYGRSVPKDVRDPFVERARAFFTEAATAYPDVRTPDGKASVGVKATHELYRLDNLSNLKVGGVAPEIMGEDLEGKPLKLSDHRGKVVVVVFWGSWCGPCMAMVPHEKELWERHRSKPFALIGVNCGDKREAAKRTASDKGMGWPSWYDGEEIRGPIETAYNVQQWPTVYVIDQKGVIRFIDVHEKKLGDAVEALLSEMK